MVAITGSIVIARPPEEVFDTVLDQRNEPSYNPEMVRSEKLSEGPVGVGTRFRAVVRRGQRELPMVVETTAVDRPHRIDSRTTMSGADVYGFMTFHPVDTATGPGTEMTWHWHLQLHGWARAARPLAGALGRAQERRIWRGLARHLEHQRPAAERTADHAG